MSDDVQSLREDMLNLWAQLPEKARAQLPLQKLLMFGSAGVPSESGDSADFEAEVSHTLLPLVHSDCNTSDNAETTPSALDAGADESRPRPGSVRVRLGTKKRRTRNMPVEASPNERVSPIVSSAQKKQAPSIHNVHTYDPTSPPPKRRSRSVFGRFALGATPDNTSSAMSLTKEELTDLVAGAVANSVQPLVARILALERRVVGLSQRLDQQHAESLTRRSSTNAIVALPSHMGMASAPHQATSSRLAENCAPPDGLQDNDPATVQTESSACD
ncbi:MAG: hypothetical protein MHM6MM_001307 [Cercozoa sp. M6MM]